MKKRYIILSLMVALTAPQLTRASAAQFGAGAFASALLAVELQLASLSSVEREQFARATTMRGENLSHKGFLARRKAFLNYVWREIQRDGFFASIRRFPLLFAGTAATGVLGGTALSQALSSQSDAARTQNSDSDDATAPSTQQKQQAVRTMTFDAFMQSPPTKPTQAPQSSKRRQQQSSSTSSSQQQRTQNRSDRTPPVAISATSITTCAQQHAEMLQNAPGAAYAKTVVDTLKTHMKVDAAYMDYAYVIAQTAACNAHDEASAQAAAIAALAYVTNPQNHTATTTPQSLVKAALDCGAQAITQTLEAQAKEKSKLNAQTMSELDQHIMTQLGRIAAQKDNVPALKCATELTDVAFLGHATLTNSRQQCTHKKTLQNLCYFAACHAAAENLDSVISVAAALDAAFERAFFGPEVLNNNQALTQNQVSDVYTQTIEAAKTAVVFAQQRAEAYATQLSTAHEAASIAAQQFFTSTQDATAEVLQAVYAGTFQQIATIETTHKTIQNSDIAQAIAAGITHGQAAQQRTSPELRASLLESIIDRCGAAQLKFGSQKKPAFGALHAITLRSFLNKIATSGASENPFKGGIPNVRAQEIQQRISATDTTAWETLSKSVADRIIATYTDSARAIELEAAALTPLECSAHIRTYVNSHAKLTKITLPVKNVLYAIGDLAAAAAHKAHGKNEVACAAAERAIEYVVNQIKQQLKQNTTPAHDVREQIARHKDAALQEAQKTATPKNKTV